MRCPNVLIHFDHQVRHLELQVVDAATGKPVHPVFSNILERDFLARTGLQPPAGGPYNTDAINDDVTAFPWDGTRLQSNGNKPKTKVVPDGQYKLIVKVLNALGDRRQSQRIGRRGRRRRSRSTVPSGHDAID